MIGVTVAAGWWVSDGPDGLLPMGLVALLTSASIAWARVDSRFGSLLGVAALLGFAVGFQWIGPAINAPLVIPGPMGLEAPTVIDLPTVAGPAAAYVLLGLSLAGWVTALARPFRVWSLHVTEPPLWPSKGNGTLIRPSEDGCVIGITQRDQWWRQTTECILSRPELAVHGIILGGSGFGKTHLLKVMLAGGLLSWSAGIFIDPKADPELANFVEGCAPGRVLRWTLGGAQRWNMLSRGTPAELRDKVMTLFEWTEPHYKAVSSEYLFKVFTTIRASGEAGTADLRRVLRLLQPDALAALAKNHLDADEFAQMGAYLRSLDKSALSGISGLRSKIAEFVEADEADSLCAGPGALDILEEIRAGHILFITMDCNRYPQLARTVGGALLVDVRMALSDLLREGYSGDRGCWLIVDEVHRLDLEKIELIFDTARGSGVTVFVATQSLSNLKRVRPEFQAALLDSANVKIIFRQTDPDGVNTLASVIGTRADTKRTRQIRAGRATDMGSEREVEEFVVHPNEFKRLRRGEAVVVVGMPKRRVERVTIAGLPSKETGLAAGWRAALIRVTQQRVDS